MCSQQMDTQRKVKLASDADEFSRRGEITIVNTDPFNVARVLRENIGQEWRQVIHSDGALLLYEQNGKLCGWRVWLEFDDDTLKIEIEEFLETGWDVLGVFSHDLCK